MLHESPVYRHSVSALLIGVGLPSGHALEDTIDVLAEHDWLLLLQSTIIRSEYALLFCRFCSFCPLGSVIVPPKYSARLS